MPMGNPQIEVRAMGCSDNRKRIRSSSDLEGIQRDSRAFLFQHPLGPTAPSAAYPQNAPRGAQVRSEAECLEVHPVEWGARKKRRSRWERTKRDRLSRL